MTETEKQVVKYDVTEAAISEMRNLYMDLTVSDLEDQEGFEAVESGRKVIKGYRVATEKQRKVFKSDALEYGRMVDLKAKEIFSLLEPIETHLIKEGDKIRDEEKRIEAEEEAKEKAKVQGRVDDLLKVNIVLDYFTVATMTDEDYDTFYTTSRTNYEAEQERIAEEERKIKETEAAEKAEREAESKRLADEKERLEKWDKEQKEKEAKIKADAEKLKKQQRELAEQKNHAREQSLKAIGVFRAGYAGEALTSKYDDFIFSGPTLDWNIIRELSDGDFNDTLETLNSQIIKFGIEKKAEVEKAREQERKDREVREKRLAEEIEARAQKEAQDAADRAAQEKIKAEAEAERQEALKPDKEKLIALAYYLQGIEYPELKSDEANIIRAMAAKQIYDIGNEILQDIEGL